MAPVEDEHADPSEGSLLQAAFLHAPVGIVVLRGADHIIELANPMALHLWGDMKLEDVVGRPFFEVFPKWKDRADDAPLQRMLKHAYELGEPFAVDEWELRLDQHGAGAAAKAIVKLNCQPLRDAHGMVTRIMATAVDVTRQAKARKRVQSLAEELQLADRRKDELLAMLGHELRNPLAAISTALELLKQAEGDTERTLRHRETAQRQMTNLVRLVDDLLDVARITQGKVELRRDALDFVTVVDSALTSMRPSIEARGHTLKVSIAPGVYPMLADGARLEQVITNLLTNAAKYTDEPGVISLRLTRERLAGATQALLRISDTGRGIPQGMLQKIFEMFMQIDPSIDRTAGGLGVGLTLVKRLVELHRGRVIAMSEGTGKGAKMVVRLPLDPSVEVTLHKGPSESEPPPALRARRIVIVEDSIDAREMLKELLENAGHDVEVVDDGLKGVERIIELAPDVAVIDLGLPTIDGYHVARRVRAMQESVRTFLIALTGYGGPEVRMKAEAAGFDMHLTKPVDIRKLFQAFDRSH